MTSSAKDIDPITFEVVRNKLQAITEEQAITLKSVSGSPVVTSCRSRFMIWPARMISSVALDRVSPTEVERKAAGVSHSS